MTGYKLLLLKDMLKELGEDEVKKQLSLFSCSINPDVEKFLKDNKAIVFENQNWSATHIVYTAYKQKMQLAGYFTLAQKTFVIPDKSVR